MELKLEFALGSVSVQALTFNRTIVELKHKFACPYRRFQLSFNRTIVELKLFSGQIFQRCDGVSFNRTIVELKQKTRPFEMLLVGLAFNRTIVELKHKLLKRFLNRS